MLLAVVIAEIIVVFVLLYIYDKFVSDPKNYMSLAVVNRQAKGTAQIPQDFLDSEGQIAALPNKFLIKNVPFASQAPDGVWDSVAEESCEEAAMLMVDYYWRKKSFSKEVALAELEKLVDFEIMQYGDATDEDAQEIAQRFKEYFGYQDIEIIYDFSLEDLKQKITEGRPIIVPAAGRWLKNPNFKQPGPLYHNLVIIGYEGNEIITNDPGTKKGEGYRYKEDVLYNAIHDFPGSKEAIEQGRKAMVIVRN